MADLEQFRRALATLGPDDMNQNGSPSADEINDALEAIGADTVTAAERDALWERHLAEPAVPETLDGTPLAEAPEGMVKITVTAASARPVPVYVNGFGLIAIPWGEPTFVPEDVLGALRTSDVQFTVEGETE